MEKTLEEMIRFLPVGFFHYRLLVMAGLGFMADAMEITLLSFLSVCIAKDWHLSDSEMATVTSVVFAGEMFGCIFWGAFADKYGRRRAYLLVFICVPGFLSGIAPNLKVLYPLRFLVGFGVGGLSVPFDLLAEFLPSSHRGRFLMYIELFWTIGSMLVAGIAWAILTRHGWRVLTFITAIPATLASVTSVVYLPESARWHVEHGRVKEAEEVIRAAAVTNGTQLPEFVLVTEIDDDSNSSASITRTPSMSLSPASKPSQESLAAPEPNKEAASRTPSTLASSSFLQEFRLLFSHSQRWITLPLWTIWFCFGFTYYGIILFISRLYTSDSNSNSGDNNDGSSTCQFHYDSILINASTEVIGVIVVASTIDRLGRTRCQALLYLGSAISVAFMGLKSQGVALVIAAGFARFLIYGASSATWVATPELFQTRVRATGHALSSALARLGATISPYLVQNHISVSVVGGVLCLVNLVAACFAFILPETTGHGLDDALQGQGIIGAVTAKYARNPNELASDEDLKHRSLLTPSIHGD